MTPDVFRAIADPTRRAILDRLSTGERPAGELAASFSVTAGAVSQHLKVLRDAELVHVRREGRSRIYTLAPDRLREVHDWVEHYRAFWESSFDALGDLLDRQTQEGP